jgi:phosphatidylglycerophosphate synthase
MNNELLKVLARGNQNEKTYNVSTTIDIFMNFFFLCLLIQLNESWEIFILFIVFMILNFNH